LIRTLLMNGRVPTKILSIGSLSLGLLVLPLAGAIWLAAAKADEAPRVLPAPTVDDRSNRGTESAVLAGGCFWGMQGVFEHVKGVTNVLSGYAGGQKNTAEYDTVSGGDTGHAESVKITFDPRQISYGEILRVHFSVAHDPTQLNRQGPDEGTQYRSEIFTASPAQEKVAREYIAQLTKAHAFGSPIVTRIEPLKGFYAAEAYHQDYLIHHPENLYIQLNDLPKIAALKRVYPNLYRDVPATVAAR
jgi:peptide-methionine (S)-S-oxide reductase